MLRWNDRRTNLITGSRVTKGRGGFSPLPRGWSWELTLSHCVFSIIIPFIVIKTVRNVFFAFRLNIVPRCWKHSRDSIFYVSFPPSSLPSTPSHRISNLFSIGTSIVSFIIFDSYPLRDAKNRRFFFKSFRDWIFVLIIRKHIDKNFSLRFSISKAAVIKIHVSPVYERRLIAGNTSFSGGKKISRQDRGIQGYKRTWIVLVR